MAKLSEIELSEIKWCAQELHRLIGLDPNNPLFGGLHRDIEALILNNLNFQNIEAKPPVIENESQA